eukprot:12497646-Ditylum_brightwellii.AAC.1
MMKNKLEEIDNKLTEAMLLPEQQIPIPHHTWWSDTIKVAHLIVQYWKTGVSMLKHPQQDETILQDIADTLGPGVDIYQGNNDAFPNSQLCRTIKYRKQCCNNSYKLRQ